MCFLLVFIKERQEIRRKHNRNNNLYSTLVHHRCSLLTIINGQHGICRKRHPNNETPQQMCCYSRSLRNLTRAWDLQAAEACLLFFPKLFVRQTATMHDAWHPIKLYSWQYHLTHTWRYIPWVEHLRAVSFAPEVPSLTPRAPYYLDSTIWISPSKQRRTRIHVGSSKCYLNETPFQPGRLFQQHTRPRCKMLLQRELRITYVNNASNNWWWRKSL